MQMLPGCAECGHDYTGYGTADGPAYIAICIVSTITTVLAMIVEMKWRPEFWVHAVLWGPFVIVACLLCLRYAKAWIVATHYANAIHEPSDITQVRAQHQGSEFQS
jgi:uncharacterized protein (DUF983 family)